MVELLLSMGIDREINCYSMIPWKLSFRYYDQASDGMKFVNAEVGSPEYREFWFPFLVDFARHLKTKGWFGMTTIAMDERPMDQMQKAIALIKEADPEYKVALAGNYHAQIEKDIFDYSIASGKFFRKMF
ncbi:MAG: glycoside hydrolase domain-containing protein [Odoribacter sp.]